MINNIIFLDIDGVLNSNKYFDSINNKECINPVDRLMLDIDMSKVKILLEIIGKTKANIVITSSWRRMKLYPYIKERLITMGLPVVGETPFIEGRRGEAIKLYLANNYCVPSRSIVLEGYLQPNNLSKDKVSTIHIIYKLRI